MTAFSSIDLPLPRCRIPYRRPVYEGHPALEGVGKGDLFVHDGLRSSGRLTGTKAWLSATSPSVIKASELGLHLSTITAHVDAGVTADIDMGTWAGLTVLAVVNTTVPAGSLNHTQLRWSSEDSRGVSLSLLDDSGAMFTLRGLIETEGSGIWTAGQDAVLPASYVNRDIVIAMTFDGATRRLYAAPAGRPLLLLRADTCTGAISSQSGAECRMHGGANSKSLGQGKQYLTLIKSGATSHAALNEVSKDIGSLFVPRREYWALPGVGSAPVMASALRGA